jgi:hypothetical protein
MVFGPLWQVALFSRSFRADQRTHARAPAHTAGQVRVANASLWPEGAKLSSATLRLLSSDRRGLSLLLC